MIYILKIWICIFLTHSRVFGKCMIAIIHAHLERVTTSLRYFFSYPIDTYNLFFDRVNFGYVHQSNGGDLSKSRSWDRLFIEGVYAYDNFVFGLKTWYRIKEDASKDDNPDILDYMGYGELSMGYLFNQHLFTLTLRNNLKSDNKGAIILDYSYPIYKSLYLYVQYFSGYGESLIDYNRSIDRIGVGLLFTR